MGSRYQKDGNIYIKIDQVKVDIKASSLRAQFSNLFNGQKALEKIGNDVINQNIDMFRSSVLPQVERAMEKKILIAANQVFERAPESEFFPWGCFLGAKSFWLINRCSINKLWEILKYYFDRLVSINKLKMIKVNKQLNELSLSDPIIQNFVLIKNLKCKYANIFSLVELF